MKTATKILAPTDLSEVSAVGVRHALEMARLRGAEVIAYYVIETSDQWVAERDNFASVCEMLSRHKRLLDKFLREKFPDYLNLIEVRQIVELGTPHNEIIEKAKREGVDMIVMSTYGRTGLHHLLVTGSVSEKVVSRAPCPVLIIPARERSSSVPEAASRLQRDKRSLAEVDG
jgi:nucleotide-binding universal stress UspA family protein